MFKKLNLSKEQQAQMDGNREKHRAEFEAMKKQMSDKREALRKVLDAEMLDMKAVQAAHQELKDLILKMEDYHLAAVLEIRQVLTPEQFKQFQAMAPKGGPKGEGRKEGRGGFHGEGKGEVEEQHPPMADGK
jgi:Spy/CpxP family protein refolding chaperone